MIKRFLVAGLCLATAACTSTKTKLQAPTGGDSGPGGAVAGGSGNGSSGGASGGSSESGGASGASGGSSGSSSASGGNGVSGSGGASGGSSGSGGVSGGSSGSGGVSGANGGSGGATGANGGNGGSRGASGGSSGSGGASGGNGGFGGASGANGGNGGSRGASGGTSGSGGASGGNGGSRGASGGSSGSGYGGSGSLCPNGTAEQFLAPVGPQSSGIYFSPNPYSGGALDGPLGATPATWYASQWNIPRNLEAANNSAIAAQCTASPAPVSFATANANARICMHNAGDGTAAMELAQSLIGVTCATNPTTSEFDLFISPTDGNYPSYTAGIVPVSAQPTLAQLTSLVVSFGAQLTFANVPGGCGGPCGASGNVDYGFFTVGVPLDTQNQTLFFQVQIWDSREGKCGGAQYACGARTFWYQNTPPTYGYSVSVGSMAGSSGCLTAGGSRHTYTINILPSILAGLASSGRPATIDADPAHWRVSGLYVGTGIEGQAAVVSVVDHVSIAACQ